jgi:chromosome segregation ATPase
MDSATIALIVGSAAGIISAVSLALAQRANSRREDQAHIFKHLRETNEEIVEENQRLWARIGELSERIAAYETAQSGFRDEITALSQQLLRAQGVISELGRRLEGEIKLREHFEKLSAALKEKVDELQAEVVRLRGEMNGHARD